jgi:hypothetical protein
LKISAMKTSLAGIDWRDLSPDLKAQLKAEAEAGGKGRPKAGP